VRAAHTVVPSGPRLPVEKGKTLENKRRRIDVVSERAFLADLGDVPMAVLRERRGLCEDLDGELSYYRRLLHGRLDLLGFEMRRRSGEETRSLIEALPEILSDDDDTPPREAMPKNLPIELPDMGERRRAIDRALDDDFLTHLPAVADEDLSEIETQLAAVEREISSQRKAVHQALDAILEELTRRYRDGSASVDELLEQA
jgi:hypothetical protein